MAESTDIREAPTDNCPMFGTGTCCRDRCRSLDGVPEAAVKALGISEQANTLCGLDIREDLTTDEPTKVSCRHCRERMFS